ncbi:50S ribosomal protein L22 [bacterium Unc6]|nr:50S ribosomal protein L22 [bacterium Unc6]
MAKKIDTRIVSKAFARYIRMTPRKVRGVIDLVRGKRLKLAYSILIGVNKSARLPVEKVIKSAETNAKRSSPTIDTSGLIIKHIWADEGPLLGYGKRFRAAPMGRAMQIKKKTCHIGVELAVK